MIPRRYAVGPCRYCDEQLSMETDQQGEPWYFDADGATVCPAASIVVYLGHEPLPGHVLLEEPQVVP